MTTDLIRRASKREELSVLTLMTQQPLGYGNSLSFYSYFIEVN